MNETMLRLLMFIMTVVILTIWEFLSPRIKRNYPRSKRWISNYILAALNIVLLRVVFPILPVGIAILADENNWGFFNYLSIPYIPAVILSVLLLDLVIYLQHVMFHSIPMFWRIHMMHHTDLDLDLSSGLRFHPVEHLFSMIIKISAVALIGAPVLSVIIFEIVLNIVSMFNHSNVYIPEKLDSLIRTLIVTPDMHRIHHSVRINETNSNFGFNLSWWDRIFRTYKYQPDAGHQNIVIGHALHRKDDVLNLIKMLLIPFNGKEGKYPINR